MDTAVHEMRAPLSVAAGYLAMATAGDLGQLEPQVRNALEVTANKVRETVEIAEELLSVARLEGGILKLVPAEVDATGAAQAAAERASARAALAKGTVEVVSGPPVKVRADPEVLARALDNLVNNAILYVDGPPRVTLRVGRNGTMGTIEVQDNGRGVPDAEREAIFGRFVRGRQAQAGGPRGSGLGLYISRAFAERMGGTLRLTETGPGKGSTFVLSLPLA
jgi:signal transduction histidine kinase